MMMLRRLAVTRRRFCSSSTSATSATQDLNHKYSKSLSLPQTGFPSRSLQSLNEQYLKESTEILYKKQLVEDPARFKNQRDLFVLHDGPPYANGDLHLGHSINKILKDIVNRSKLLNSGQKVMYIPGFDCHGLPIELKALESLRKSSQKTTTTEKLSYPEIRKIARNHALATIEKQTATFKKFAVMGEWENPYKTLNKSFEINQLKIFKKMFQKNLLKRQKKPVYWGWETGTALAEGELEYNDKHKSTAAFVKFPFAKIENPDFKTLLKSHNLLSDVNNNLKNCNISLLIWTSTPWTLVANKAICFNEDFEYTFIANENNSEYLVVLNTLVDNILPLNKNFSKTDIVFSGKFLKDNRYVHPVTKEISPLLHGSHVTDSAGTGLVHTAPGHGQDDYLMSLNNDIEVYSPVDSKGKYTDELLPGFESFVGLHVFSPDTTKKMLAVLAENSMLYKIDYKYIHSYPYDWRSKKPIIIRSTPQWFTDLSTVKQKAIDAVNDVKFHPKNGKNRLLSFITTRNEWCISRQRCWGVPIPVFYDKKTQEPLINEQTLDHIISKVDELGGTDAWFDESIDISVWLPQNYQHLKENYVKGTDTIDVWFDSGSSWTFIEQILSEKNLLASRKHIADVYLEGSDQHRGWFQSSLLTKMAADTIFDQTEKLPSSKSAPYGTVITHGFTLDEKGVKMSKSIGNTIDPLDVINGNNKKLIPKVGVDGLRMWVATNDYTKDLTMSSFILKQVSNNLKKIRFTFKFLLGNLGDNIEGSKTQVIRVSDSSKLSNIDKYVLIKLYDFISTVDSYYDGYQYSRLIKEFEYFVSTDLSSIYFNVIKDKLYTENQSEVVVNIRSVLQEILLGCLYSLSPIIPIITQEVWSHYKHDEESASPLTHNYDFSNLKAISFACKNDILELFDQNIWKVRDEALKLIDNGRNVDKLIRTSLEADIIINTKDQDSKFAKLISRSFTDTQYKEELADIFQVSNVFFNKTIDESEYKYCFKKQMLLNGEEIEVVVINSKDHKCPRCWKYTAPAEDSLCHRCDSVLNS